MAEGSDAARGDGLPLRGTFGLTGGRLQPVRFHRDLFPIPLVEPEPPRLHDHRRGTRRARRRADHTERVNSTLAALNWMNGYKDRSALPVIRCDTATTQGEAQLRVEGLVRGRREPTDLDPPGGALKRLLQGRSPYELDGVNANIAPFRMKLLSLPDSVLHCPELQEVLPPGPRAYLEGYQQRMLRVDLEPSAITPVVPHWDMSLKYNKKCYNSLVRRLFDIGLLRPVARSREKIGLFTVWKAGHTSQRLIVDARRSNCHFLDPPSVQLLTAEGFGRFEVRLKAEKQIQDLAGQADLEETHLRFVSADVRDCFHRFRAPLWMSEFFTLPPVAAHVVRMVGQPSVGGEIAQLQAGDPVLLGWAGLPMGCTWSLYFAQEANTHQLLRAPSLRPFGGDTSMLATDRGGAFVMEAGSGRSWIGERESQGYGAFVYVDNLGALVTGGTQQEAEGRASALGEEWSAHFESLGLALHKAEVEENPETLGVQLDTERFKSSVTQKRFWRIRQATHAILGQRRVSGWSLEVLMGHITFCCLANRLLLGCFHTVYRFISSCYGQSEILWSEVRSELVCFLGLMEFLEADWWLPWSPEVHQSDSSLSGWGVKRATWPVEVVARCGHVSERSRFKRLGAHSAREHALTLAGLRRLPSGRWVAESPEGCEADLENFVDNGDFPEFPPEGLRERVRGTHVSAVAGTDQKVSFCWRAAA